MPMLRRAKADTDMVNLELRIDDARWQSIDALESICDTACAAGGAVENAKGVVSVLLADNEILQDLNHRFRGKDKPTDVLSFPATPLEAPLLGDIAVSYDLAEVDAGTQGKTLPDHLSHLLIHGVLHLLGHDHENDADAQKMETLEIKALASIGIDNPYFRN